MSAYTSHSSRDHPSQRDRTDENRIAHACVMNSDAPSALISADHSPTSSVDIDLHNSILCF